MKKELTEMVFILDKSGSMHGLERDTIGGFNAMIEKQKQEKGGALVSTILFNCQCETMHDRRPLKKIKPLSVGDYQVGGATALIDAIGGAIKHIKQAQKNMREEDRPQKTIFIIVTDGMENASTRFQSGQVKKMIVRQKRKNKWEFLFLGANIDAVETAAHFGIDRERAVNFHNDSAGTSLNYQEVGETIALYRCGKPITGNWKEKIEQDFIKRGKSKI